MSAEKEVPRFYIFPKATEKFPDGIIWQHGNARPHIAKKVTLLFEEEDIIVLKWPPYSPDLNPIEFLWKKIKSLVYDGPQLKKKQICGSKF